MLLPYFREHYGDIASVLGLVVTFVGFAVTIHGVRRARRVAEEALARIKAQLFAENVSVALQTVRQIDSACRSFRWDDVQDRCDDARVALSQLGANQRLLADEVTLVRATLNDLGDLLAHVQKLRKASAEKSVPPRFSRRLHNVIAMLGKAQEGRRSETLEV